MTMKYEKTLAALAVCALGFADAANAGVGDGPRAYQNAPVGTRVLTFTYMKQDSGFNIDGSPSEPASRIDADIVVLQYSQVVNIAGNAAGLFAIAPMGRVDGSLIGTKKSGKSTGLGDIQLGMVLGLVGSPALTAQEYGANKPGFSMGLLAKVSLPTGKYASDKAVNFGTNRIAMQLGLPMTWNLGGSHIPGHVTTLELTPTMWVYGDNTAPTGGASFQSREPLYSIEAHLTHDFSSKVWGSLDAVYSRGGATKTDGSSDENGLESLGVGVTMGFALERSYGLQFSYGKTPKSNTDGLQDQLFRVKLTRAF